MVRNTIGRKRAKESFFDCFARLWRFGHISLVRTPIDAIQDVPESQQTGLQLCGFQYQLKMTSRGTHDSTAHFRGVCDEGLAERMVALLLWKSKKAKGHF